MAQMTERWSAVFGELGIVELRIVESLVAIVVLVVLRTIVAALIRRNVQDARVRYHGTKIISYATALLGLFLVGRIWFVGFRSIATFLGIVAAGLVISLKEPVLNMAGWVFLLWRRPFNLGDRIQIGDHCGDVIDRRLFQFSILEIGNWVEADQSTGRIIHVPNGRLFTEPLANYTRAFPYIWNEVAVTVTFESDWREAKRLLLEIGERRRLPPEVEAQIRAASQQYLIFYTRLSPAVYVNGGAHGVVLTLRYMCGARERRGTTHAIWEDVLDAFAAHEGIDMAYATQRFFDRGVEKRTLRMPGGTEGMR